MESHPEELYAYNNKEGKTMTQDSVGETDKSHRKINKKDSEEKEW